MANNDWIVRANAAAVADAGETAAQLELSDRIYDESGNRSIPEFSTSWSRPGEDWRRYCQCEYMTLSADGEHHCPYAGQVAAVARPLGDRAVALTRVVSGASRFPDPDGEVIRLTSSDYDDDAMFGLTVSQAERQSMATRGEAMPDGSFPIGDEGHLAAAVREYHAGHLAGYSRQEVAAHIRKNAKRLGVQVELSDTGGGPIPLAGPQGDGGAFTDAAQHYADLMSQMGLESAPRRGRGRYHGKAGSGRSVSSRTRAHVADSHGGDDDRYPGDTDPDQPRRGGVAHPGVSTGVYGGTAGDIISRHRELFVSPGDDRRRRKFPSRASRLAHGGYGGTAPNIGGR